VTVKLFAVVKFGVWSDMLDELIVFHPDSIESSLSFPRGLRSKIYFWESARQRVLFLHSDYQKFIILLARHYALNNFIDRLTSTVSSTNISVLITMVAASRFRINATTS